MPAGTFRRVIVLWRWAIKVPRLRNFRAGLRCNAWEREAWFVWRPKFGWRDLCPIVVADPLGLLVVMPRVDLSVSADDLDRLLEEVDCHPMSDAELRIGNVGRLHGRIVAFDYGLPDAEDVRERREYYRIMDSRAR